MDSKSTSLTFEYSPSEETEQDTGVLVSPFTETWKFCEEKFDLSLESRLDAEEYIKNLTDILEIEPTFLDAYSHLGLLFFKNEYLDEAEKWYKKGLTKAISIIPKDFSGTINWGNLNNRPFLRLHHGYLLCQLRKGKFKKAVVLMEEHLAWNDNDNLGIRFLIGDACLMCGMTRKAKQDLTDTQAEFPPCAYSLALLEFMKERYVEAATALRLGIATNHYITEGLTGREELNPHFYWHGHSYSTDETAQDYLYLGGYDMWAGVSGAIEFCDWLFNCSAVLRERAKIMEAREGLTYERDYEVRGVYSDKIIALINSIDSSLSKKIVKLYHDRYGNEMWPWEKEE